MTVCELLSIKSRAMDLANLSQAISKQKSRGRPAFAGSLVEKIDFDDLAMILRELAKPDCSEVSRVRRLMERAA